ncbi:MAG: DUF3810 family protein [Christensenellales bacterium]|jgi:hypothetical protein
MGTFWVKQKTTMFRELPGRSWRSLGVSAGIGTVLLVIAWPIFNLVKNRTRWAEYFGQYVYPKLTAFFSSFWGIFPFSAAEFLFYGCVLGGACWAFAVVIQILGKGYLCYRLLSLLLSTGLIACSIWASFCYGWGILYQREPLANRLALTVRASSSEDLSELCAFLIAEKNALRITLSEDESGCCSPEMRKEELLITLPVLYNGLEGLDFLGGDSWCPPKSVSLSRQMRQREIVGICIWMTTEPNVNTDIPATTVVFNALHKIAHQRGYAREDKANYLAYLACMYSEDDDILYSGMLSALVHTMNKLYETDSGRYRTLREHIAMSLTGIFSGKQPAV